MLGSEPVVSNEGVLSTGSAMPKVPRLESQGPVLTHGYVHGHVHHHKDHMHIHGHFHNHDHVFDQGVATDMGPGSIKCEELDDNFKFCDEVRCDDLEDCYFYDCEKTNPVDGLFDTRDQACDKVTDVTSAECCNNPECLVEPSKDLCVEDGCPTAEQHDNSLCDFQRPKLSIFENLIQNVQRNVEEYLPAHAPVDEPLPKKARLSGYEANDATNPSLNIHFPHHCHQDHIFTEFGPKGPSLENSTYSGSHNSHHSCFHVKLPVQQDIDIPVANSLDLSESPENTDYDFLVQFNNFNQLLENDLAQQSKPSQVKPSATEPYTCQWENCYQSVDNASLLNHLFDAHLKEEYQIGSNAENVPEFECEWDNCDFHDSDLKQFLSHLNSHKLDHEAPPEKKLSPLLTPSSIELIPDTPLQIKEEEHRGPVPPLNITQMRISPKAKTDHPDVDSSFTCKWQLGTNPDGTPIICNKTHASSGDLQEHLQEDHIGRGKSIYHCCWHGCERNHGKPFIQRQKLFRHIHIHTGHKPCVCDVCGASFAVPAMLRQHQRIHSGERPYTCDTCGKSFTTSSSLAIHARMHSGAKPLKCNWPGCKKKFREASNLAKHTKRHAISHKCSSCDEEFGNKKTLRAHEKSHDSG